MTGQSDMKSKTLPNLGKRIKAMAVSRKIQSSGYAKEEEKQKLFRPRINKKRMNTKVKSYIRAWESNDGKYHYSIKSFCFDFRSVNLGSSVIGTSRSEGSLLPYFYLCHYSLITYLMRNYFSKNVKSKKVQ